jgi:hypothetical protein
MFNWPETLALFKSAQRFFKNAGVLPMIDVQKVDTEYHYNFKRHEWECQHVAADLEYFEDTSTYERQVASGLDAQLHAGYLPVCRECGALYDGREWVSL